jgi:hypothetical protein
MRPFRFRLRLLLWMVVIVGVFLGGLRYGEYRAESLPRAFLTPLTTTLQCPHCGYFGRTTKLTKVRCLKCKNVMRVVQTDEWLVETIPVVGRLAASEEQPPP